MKNKIEVLVRVMPGQDVEILTYKGQEYPGFTKMRLPAEVLLEISKCQEEHRNIIKTVKELINDPSTSS